MYWGLDYPPLTAYHSLLVGWIARLVNPAYVELRDSRGYESLEHQFFMRMSVLISDFLIFLSAVYFYIKSIGMSSKFGWVVFAICYHPALTLIDYGHFQYNTVSLGLALWAVVFIRNKRYLLAAVAFSLALNFKQMELYHALPIFFYLLAVCWSIRTYTSKVLTLIKIGLVTGATFAAVWYPFLSSASDFQQVVRRVLPFDRGIFEDYVANFWCSLNVVVKVRNLFEPQILTKICLSLTALAAFPSGIHLYLKPKFTTLLISLINVSMAFFLFSFHVHEKSILLAALPVSLFSPYRPLACIWFLIISHFSMLPLYIKDDVVIPSIALLVLYVILAYNCLKFDFNRFKWLKLALAVSVIGSILLAVLALTCRPPAPYPYLWTLLISVFSFGHFSAFFLYFLWLQFFQCDSIGPIQLN